MVLLCQTPKTACCINTWHVRTKGVAFGTAIDIRGGVIGVVQLEPAHTRYQYLVVVFSQITKKVIMLVAVG